MPSPASLAVSGTQACCRGDYGGELQCWGWEADLHGVGLASAGLAICKDGAVEALQNLLHNGGYGYLVDLGLPCLWVKDLRKLSR